MRTRIAAFVLALGTLVTVLGAGPAQAAGYRYWSFWDRDGVAWKYAAQGPSLARPADGDVQGFRFSVSEDSQDSAKPRGAADFEAICGSTPARDGRKRVALVIDFGKRGDAPGGETPPATRTECAQVGVEATSAEALAAVAKPLRYNGDALLCAIAGYPKTGCGERVSGGTPKSSPSAAPSASPAGASDGGPSAGLVAGIAAVLGLGAAGAWQARRRRGQG
ncbi:SCO2322 family protein [Streptomyces sp. NPDC051219]|uniref:SCO2322 family protein n=1 Tax=Streptomyces sp. NPDC051219 TaxID=3155283 RepID=UPI00343C405F